MDRHALALLIPIIVMGFTGIIAFSFTPLGRALARRLSGQAASPELEGRVAQLEGDLDAVRHELAETQERQDFTERALAQLKERNRLPPGSA
jgi:hypothetical protein